MLIDWFTIGAQALNFLILVWLMKRFLYKPILHAIGEREKRIATELANADKKKAEAQKESDDFQHKNEEFDQQRAVLLSKATEEVKAERQKLLDEARISADIFSAKRMESLRSDAQNLTQSISRKTQQEVFSIARKTLIDLGAISLEERICEVFICRIREMDIQSKETLTKAMKSSSTPALVRSTFELPKKQRDEIQNVVNGTFSVDVQIRFETTPDLVSGIEFTINGQKLEWSIADYLASLEKGVNELLKEKNKIEAKAETAKEMTSKITKRAYELFEKGGRKSDSAIQDWSQAEREVREAGTKTEPKPETKDGPKPETKKVESKPEEKPEPKPDVTVEPKTKEAKPETKVGPKPETKKVESKSEEKSELKPDVTVEPKTKEANSEVKAEPKADVKDE